MNAHIHKQQTFALLGGFSGEATMFVVHGPNKGRSEAQGSPERDRRRMAPKSPPSVSATAKHILCSIVVFLDCLRADRREEIDQVAVRVAEQ